MADNELAAVRSIRRDISDECGGELDRVFDYYEEVQERMQKSGRYEFINEPIRNATPLDQQRHVTSQ